MTFSYLADLASLVGLLLTIGGFVVTIKGVGAARRAAEDARRAAREAVSRIGERLLDDEATLTLQFALEIDTACRDGDWGIASLRGNDIRLRLGRLVEHQQLRQDERDDLRIILESLPSMLSSLARLRNSAIKQFPARHHGTLHNLVMLLGQIRGRIQSVALEV